VLAFKGVLLEGLEIAFIVVAFGAGGHGYGSAYAGALAAFVIFGGLGFAAKGQLEKVPGRTLKFAVGGLLSTFGTFWTLEGLGVHWPGDDLSLAWLYVLYLGATVALMQAARAGWLGPAPRRGANSRRDGADSRREGAHPDWRTQPLVGLRGAGGAGERQEANRR
jgi:uncharacterized membrane protein